MKNKQQKIIIFFLLLFLFLVPFNFIFSQRELEVEYPEIRGFKPVTVKTLISDYAKYIFNFCIFFAGLVAFCIILFFGIRYLTSTGKPDVLNSSKDRIKSAFFGLLILLFSYLILTTINPDLVVFQTPGLPQVPSVGLPATPISPFVTSDLLSRIREMAITIQEVSNSTTETVDKLNELIGECDCKNTQPLCYCTGGGKNDKCEPRQCYAGRGTYHPCPKFNKIKDSQKLIIVFKEELLYYRNRALSEREDLKENLEILNKDIGWWNDKIAADEAVLPQLTDSSAREAQQKVIDSSKEERDWLAQERDYKEILKGKLEELAKVISKIEVEKPVDILSQLPDKCLIDVNGENAKCKASCQEGKEFGCHDAILGCQPKVWPEGCSGGNPCPVNEISNQTAIINSITGDIEAISSDIIAIINAIPKIRARETQL